jgi:hypothetical protein
MPGPSLSTLALGLSSYRSGGTPTPTPSYENMPKLAAALIDVADDVRDALLIFAGDSVTYGNGVGLPTGGTDGARARSIPVRIGEQLEALGVKVSCDGWLGLGSNAGSVSEFSAYYEAAGTLTGALSIPGWTPLGPTWGGYVIAKASATPGASTFVPVKSWRYMHFWIIVTTSNAGGIAFEINGSPVATYVNSTLGVGFHKVILDAGSEGTHTFSWDTINATQVIIAGCIPYSSTEKRLHIINTGLRGAEIGDFTDTGDAYNAVPAALALAPDCVEISLGINDFRGGGGDTTTYNNFIAAVDGLATTLGGTADILVRLPTGINPAEDAGPDYFLDPDVWAWYRSWAASRSFNVLDTPDVVGDYDVVNGGGHMQDWLHPDYTIALALGTAQGDLIKAAVDASTVPGQTLTGSAPPVVVGAPYTFQPIRTGGAGARTFSISAGTLHTGLSINSATGEISGTVASPAAASTVTIQSVDSVDTATMNITPPAVAGAWSSFTASDGTDGVATATDSGHSWTATASSAWTIGTNRLYISAHSSQNNLLISSVSLHNNQFASCRLNRLSNGTQSVGVAVRASAAVCYAFVWRQTASRWELVRQSNTSTWNVLAYAAGPLSWGGGVLIRLEVSGTTLTCFINDAQVTLTRNSDSAQVTTITDATLASGGAGFAARVVGDATISTGWHVDDFRCGPLA